VGIAGEDDLDVPDLLRQACIVCGRERSDPHHLSFMQVRALGRKVSDEFVVPLSVSITGKSIARATSGFGGNRSVSTRSRSRVSCGLIRASMTALSSPALGPNNHPSERCDGMGLDSIAQLQFNGKMLLPVAVPQIPEFHAKAEPLAT
jgi:hypothetical protein